MVSRRQDSGTCRGGPRGRSRHTTLALSLITAAVAATSALVAVGSAFAGAPVRMRGVPRTPRPVFVGEPTFRPAYGFEPANPLGPDAAAGESVPGLKAWLKKMGMEEDLDLVNRWCEEMGAAVMAEVLDELDELIDWLPEAQAQVIRKRGRVSYSFLEQTGELVPQKDVLDGDERGFAKYSGRVILKGGKRKDKGKVADVQAA
eukprot:CAMPEP_0115501770 /NCGR_PEP_ID=MMETSP0271-20121206/68575_1 /TAXON_ID=71861 /ORGANISM="Scrippsiella trochoidea, Strain CCMP3099" /LENGTH=202 /DNA_ID=CAMNT_0002930727 /DNA_START=1 /DNA_END=609 /DNA_ORIENTATION=+